MSLYLYLYQPQTTKKKLAELTNWSDEQNGPLNSPKAIDYLPDKFGYFLTGSRPFPVGYRNIKRRSLVLGGMFAGSWRDWNGKLGIVPFYDSFPALGRKNADARKPINRRRRKVRKLLRRIAYLFYLYASNFLRYSSIYWMVRSIQVYFYFFFYYVRVSGDIGLVFIKKDSS